MKTKFIHRILLPAFVIGCLLTACKDTNDWVIDESANRAFRPISLEASVSGLDVTFKFYNTYENVSYNLDVSEDNLEFKNIILNLVDIQTEKIDGGSSIRYALSADLKPNTQYSARIKAVSKDGKTPESNWSTVAFKTSTEQILNPVDLDLVRATTAVLSWKVPNAVTHFMFTFTGGDPLRFDISDEEKEAGEKTFTGLTPETVYNATIYNGDVPRGSREIVTLAVLPEGDNVIILDKDDDLAAVLADCPEGSIIVLLKDSHYSLPSDAVTLPANTTFWGQGAVRPVISMNAAFTLPANAGIIKFENIDITGYEDNNPTGAKKNYIFNQSAATETDEVIFEKCIIRNLVNSPFRLQGSATIHVGKLVFNNCIAYDCGNNNGTGTYAFIHTASATNTVIDNIEITNSTMYEIGYSLILHNTSSSQSVKIEDCTFYNIIGNTRYFIDYNTYSAGTFTIKNVILAKTLSSAETARGIRANGAPTVTNTYQASDFVTSSNAIPNVTPYTGTSTDLFGNPANADFTIIDNSFGGKTDAGDPRWRR